MSHGQLPDTNNPDSGFRGELQTTFTWDNSNPNYQAFVGDYDGDRVADVALRNPSSGTFYVRYGPTFQNQTTFTWDKG